jgi:gas vesicle protein
MTFLLGLMVGAALGMIMAGLFAAGKIDDLRMEKEAIRKDYIRMRCKLLLKTMEENGEVKPGIGERIDTTVK